MLKLSLKFRTEIIPTERGFMKMVEVEDFENVNPVTWVKEVFIQCERMRSLFYNDSDVISKKEEEKWKEYYTELSQEEIPIAFIRLFDCSRKKDQEAVLKNAKITSLQMANLMCYAGLKFGYKLSKYSAWHYPNTYVDKTLPRTFHLNEKGEIEKFGSTDLSDAQLMQILKQRKLVFARILENEKQWHCFYYNDKSLKGEENYGSHHIHYISNYWTIDKNVIVNELSNRNYKFNGIHIDYVTHRNKNQ